MKPLLLALATLALTLNALGLEMVKCGSIPRPTNVLDRWLTNSFVYKSKADGTSLIHFPTGLGTAVVRPFKYARLFWPPYSRWDVLSIKTNNYVRSDVGGDEVISYKLEWTSRSIASNPDIIFKTLSDVGYIDIQRIRRSASVEEVVEKAGVRTRLGITNYPTGADVVQMVKFDLSDNEKQVVMLSDSINVDASNWEFPNPYQKSWTSGIEKRVLLMNVTAENIDFYLVTDPDLFPDTALGAPKVEGGSATFNVTTGSEEPVEIQASDDLKIWKRLKTLEDANGRSVTVPADAAQGFLRAVEK